MYVKINPDARCEYGLVPLVAGIEPSVILLVFQDLGIPHTLVEDLHIVL